MKTTTLQLPEPIFQKAVAKARRLGVSQSKMFRDAIEKEFAEEKKKQTMLDVMGDMVRLHQRRAIGYVTPAQIQFQTSDVEKIWRQK